MAEYTENLIKFGWLTYEKMLQAISNGDLNAYDIVFTSDSHEQYLIGENLIPISIKSRIRVYGSAEAAIEDIRNSSCSYVGEVISVRDQDKFIAYTVNQFNNGDWYISPVYSDKQIDYNLIQNTPIKNIKGSVTEPIIIKDLEDGQYMLTGHFITPIDTTTSSIVGNYIIVDSEVGKKKIKRICSDVIIDYVVESNGNVTSDKYATEKYIEEQGFATTVEVDNKLVAFKVTMEKYIEDYVKNTVTLLIQHIVDETLDSRYAQNSDITELFK